MKKLEFAANIVSRIIDAGLALVFVLFLLIGAYVMTDMLYIYSGAAQRGALVYKPKGNKEESANLRELSEDCVGWLTFDGTGIDYPLMQGRSNSEYLNTDPFGEYSLSGSVFLDASNKRDFTDRYCLLYGHHMEGGAMFGALDRYTDGEYLKDHSEGTLTLTDGTVYKLKIFAVLSCRARDAEMFDIGAGGPTWEYLSEHAIVLSKDPEEAWPEQILAMTTCRGAETEDRLAVLAEMIKE